MKVITRFAPSPTGMLHIGGARTALFNYLFARHHGGEFRLRIEDTDEARNSAAAYEAIVDGLKWLGLGFDGDIVYQSKNSARHREVAEELVKRGQAYHCYTTAEELAEIPLDDVKKLIVEQLPKAFDTKKKAPAKKKAAVKKK